MPVFSFSIFNLLITSTRPPRFQEWLLIATTTSLENGHTCSFCRMVALCYYHSSLKNEHTLACFDAGCSFPPISVSLKNERISSFSRVIITTTFSLENGRVCLFSRVIALYLHRHLPSLWGRWGETCDDSFFLTEYYSTHQKKLNTMGHILIFEAEHLGHHVLVRIRIGWFAMIGKFEITIQS